MTVDPLTVPCDGDDGCGAGVGEPCVTQDSDFDGDQVVWGPKVPCEPHSQRVWIASTVPHRQAADIIDSADPAMRVVLVDVLRALAAHPSIADAIRHAPHAIAAIGRVLAKGGATLGVVGSAPDRTPLAHARAAYRHLTKTLAAIDHDDRAPWAVDADTGELHGTCAAGRLALALDEVLR